MTKLFYKKVAASDEDKHLIRNLRTMLNANDTQYQLGMIDEVEYKKNLKDIIAKVVMLEGKYGL